MPLRLFVAREEVLVQVGSLQGGPPKGYEAPGGGGQTLKIHTEINRESFPW
jgi:hypothetical protein